MSRFVLRQRWPSLLALLGMALALAAVHGCGGGSVVASLPGTGGTGYTSVGTITGFGSVKVNGVFFADTTASVTIDGQSQSAAALGLGMLVTVQGQLGTVAATGTASSFDSWSQAQGSVSHVTTNGFQVAGMSVASNSGTVYLGMTSSAGLQSGMTVRVWALPTNVGLTQWQATRVEVLSAVPANVVSTGVVGSGGTQLNGLTLQGALTPLTAGQAMRVSGSPAGSVLTLVSAQPLPTVAISASSIDGDGDVEGVVTQVTASTHFLLGTLPVDASAATLVGGTSASITTGAQLAVRGSMVSGVLQASQVQVESETDIDTVQLKGSISGFVSLANFSVRGQVCDASGLTQLTGGGGLSALGNGVSVQLQGVKQGDVVRVTSISLSN